MVNNYGTNAVGSWRSWRPITLSALFFLWVGGCEGGGWFLSDSHHPEWREVGPDQRITQKGSGEIHLHHPSGVGVTLAPGPMVITPGRGELALDLGRIAVQRERGSVPFLIHAVDHQIFIFSAGIGVERYLNGDLEIFLYSGEAQVKRLIKGVTEGETLSAGDHYRYHKSEPVSTKKNPWDIQKMGDGVPPKFAMIRFFPLNSDEDPRAWEVEKSTFGLRPALDPADLQRFFTAASMIGVLGKNSEPLDFLSADSTLMKNYQRQILGEDTPGEVP